MPERNLNPQEISFSSLPQWAREQIQRVTNSYGVNIGNDLEIRRPGVVFYQGLRVVDLGGEETVSLSDLPAGARGYIRNLFGKTTLKMDLLDIREDRVYYDGKLVKMETTSNDFPYENLPQWAKDTISRCLATDDAEVTMQDGHRLVVGNFPGNLIVSFDNQNVTGIPST